MTREEAKQLDKAYRQGLVELVDNIYDSIEQEQKKEDAKTVAKKVTLYPVNERKVKRIADRYYEGNFSLALRVIIDKHEEK